jgi:glucose dehydrogenase
MNWTMQREGHGDAGVYTAEHLQARLVALLQRTSALAALDPYRDIIVAPQSHGEVIGRLAAAETERRAELARGAMGDGGLDALSDWQSEWLDQLVARDEWAMHVQELRALFDLASEQGCPVKMWGD